MDTSAIPGGDEDISITGILDTMARLKNTDDSFISNEPIATSCIQDRESNDLNELTVASGEEVHDTMPFKEQNVCDICSKIFSTVSQLKKHILIHTRPYPCSKCGKKFASESYLQKHKLTHKGIKPFTCDKCDKTFTHACSVKIHKKIHHSNAPKIKCKKCNKEVKAVYYSKHFKTHASEKRYTCDRCGKRFKDPKGVRSHMQTHDNPTKSHKCHLCDKRYNAASSLGLHMVTHCDIMPFNCNLCHDQFSQKRRWKSHVLTCIGVPHPLKRQRYENQCKLCKTCHINEADLEIHIHAHDAKKEERQLNELNEAREIISCVCCHTIFPRLLELHAHLNDRHISQTCCLCKLPYEKQPNLLKSPIKCKSISAESQLSVTIESDNTEHQCDLCFKSFRDISSLEIHKVNRHREKKCRHCELKFSDLQSLTVHAQLAHGIIVKPTAIAHSTDKVGTDASHNTPTSSNSLITSTLSNTVTFSSAIASTDQAMIGLASTSSPYHKANVPKTLWYKCYGCERLFSDLQVLTKHARARHGINYAKPILPYQDAPTDSLNPNDTVNVSASLNTSSNLHALTKSISTLRESSVMFSTLPNTVTTLSRKSLTEISMQNSTSTGSGSRKPNEQKVYKCCDCELTFSVFQRLTAHARREHGIINLQLAPPAVKPDTLNANVSPKIQTKLSVISTRRPRLEVNNPTVSLSPQNLPILNSLLRSPASNINASRIAPWVKKMLRMPTTPCAQIGSGIDTVYNIPPSSNSAAIIQQITHVKTAAHLTSTTSVNRFAPPGSILIGPTNPVKRTVPYNLIPGTTSQVAKSVTKTLTPGTPFICTFPQIKPSSNNSVKICDFENCYKVDTVVNAGIQRLVLKYPLQDKDMFKDVDYDSSEEIELRSFGQNLSPNESQTCTLLEYANTPIKEEFCDDDEYGFNV